MSIQILHIAGTDIQGRTFKHDLSPITIFTGHNGAGKTTRLKAIDLALRGPRKEDTRFGAEAGVHLRLKVPANVHPSCNVDVLRTLSPKHALVVRPLTSRSTSGYQGLLDGMTQTAPAAFDLSAYTDLSADKQKVALLPFATFVPAAQYANIYPSVVPFGGEAGSDYLTRVRAAIGEESRALAARKLSAERAQVEIANSGGHSQRTAQAIQADIDRDQAIVANAATLEQCKREVTNAEQRLAVGVNVLAMAERDLDALLKATAGDLPDLAPLAEALSEAQHAADYYDAKAEVANADAALAESERVYDVARQAHDAANDKSQQLEVLGLTALIEAAILIDTPPDDVCRLMSELRNKLRRDGFPVAKPFDATQHAQWLQASIDEAKRALAEVEARTEFLLSTQVEPADEAYWREEHAKRSASYHAAQKAHGQAGDATMQAQQLRWRIETEQANMVKLRAEADQAQRAVDAAADALDGVDVTGAADRLEVLKGELAMSMRAEGRVEAERAAYQSAEEAKASLDKVKAAEKAVKAASEDCLVKSLGAVAEAFQPCCQLLGGVWRLGDDRPLGLERDGVWVQYEHLSESERLVYGIGLVMALSTLGKGLRLVMLDGLDSCDVERRRGIIQIAEAMIAAGRLDAVLGTAWSAAGFEGKGVQVIDVTKGAA